MAKFKAGDPVYHKATGQRGVIVESSKRIPGAVYGEEEGGGWWFIAWEDKTRTSHKETELLTEEEHNKETKPPDQEE